MSCCVKKLCSALIVVAVLGALFSSAASAQFERETAEETMTVTVSSNSSQKFGFKSSAYEFSCKKLAFDDAIVTSSTTVVEELSVEPTLTECEPFLGTSLAFDMNGCKWLIHLAKGTTKGTTDIECPEGQGIDLTIGNICKYRLDTQTGLSTLQFSNVGSGATRAVTVEPTIKGMTWTRTTNDFPICPAPSSEGIYAGDFTLIGVEQTGMWVD